MMGKIDDIKINKIEEYLKTIAFSLDRISEELAVMNEFQRRNEDNEDLRY